MQGLIELMAALVIWVATVVFAQFGIEVEFARPPAARETPVVERTATQQAEQPDAGLMIDCPQAGKARIRPV